MLNILSKYFKTGLLAAFASVLIILAELSRVAFLSNECTRFGLIYSVCVWVLYFVFGFCNLCFSFVFCVFVLYFVFWFCVFNSVCVFDSVLYFVFWFCAWLYLFCLYLCLALFIYCALALYLNKIFSLQGLRKLHIEL